MGKKFRELSFKHGCGVRAWSESGKATKRRNIGKGALKHTLQNHLEPMDSANVC